MKVRSGDPSTTSAADIVEDEDAGGVAPLVLWTNPEPRALVSDGAPAAPSPELVAFTGARAAKRTIEFLTANIRNAHMRRA